MDKEEIINYVMRSPENTNANVLRGMLDQLGGGGDTKSSDIVGTGQVGYMTLKS